MKLSKKLKFREGSKLVRIIDLLSGEYEGTPIDQRSREADGSLRYESTKDRAHLTKLAKVYTKTDKRGKWLYWTWEPFEGLGHNCHYGGQVIEGDGEHIGYLLLNP